MKPKFVKCEECRKEIASWRRETQFAGMHYFCDRCVVNEKDFTKNLPDVFWTSLCYQCGSWIGKVSLNKRGIHKGRYHIWVNKEK